MASGSSDFLYEDAFDAIMAVLDADMLQNDEELKWNINSCIKNTPSKKKSSFQCEFCDNISTGGLKRHLTKKRPTSMLTKFHLYIILG